MIRGLSVWTAGVVVLAMAFGLVVAAPAGAATEKRYKDELFEVKVKRDITYGLAPPGQYGERQELKLDLYRPKGDTLRKRPVVIWVHGGGFASGDKAVGTSPVLARKFASMGYVSASINYRLLARQGCNGSDGVTEECYNAAIEAVHDAQASVRYMRTNRKQLRVDPKRIAIGGESAGAIAANGVAVLSADPGESGNPGVSSAVQGFVSISGGLPGGIFVDENTAPGLLFASTDDPIVPYSWSVETRDKMESFDVPVKLTTFQSDVHVPFVEFRRKIEKQSTRLLFKYLGLKIGVAQD